MDKALAYERDRKLRCHQCGTLRSDWVDAEGYPLEHPLWEPMAEKCHGCAEVDRLRDSISKEDPHLRGVYFKLVVAGTADQNPSGHPE